MKELDHPAVIKMRHSFFTKGNKVYIELSSKYIYIPLGRITIFACCHGLYTINCVQSNETLQPNETTCSNIAC